MFAWLLLPLAAAFGAAFPFALRLAVGDVETAPRKAALLYGVNTAGAIAGSLAAGFLLIPRLGLQRTIEGRVFSQLPQGWRSLRRVLGGEPITAAAVGAFGILGVVVVNGAGWDAALLSAGGYKYALYVRGPDLESALGAGTLLYYRDGAAGTVSVRRLAGALTLAIDGKVDASNAGDMQTQKLLAHLPLMLHARPRRVAIIGLGSGVTLGAALRHPVERATTIEISREVIDAAGFFEADNGRALADRRAHRDRCDGRSHLLLATATVRRHHLRAVQSLDGRCGVALHARVLPRGAPRARAGRHSLSVGAHVRHQQRRSAVDRGDVRVRVPRRHDVDGRAGRRPADRIAGRNRGAAARHRSVVHAPGRRSRSR